MHLGQRLDGSLLQAWYTVTTIKRGSAQAMIQLGVIFVVDAESFEGNEQA